MKLPEGKGQRIATTGTGLIYASLRVRRIGNLISPLTNRPRVESMHVGVVQIGT